MIILISEGTGSGQRMERDRKNKRKEAWKKIQYKEWTDSKLINK